MPELTYRTFSEELARWRAERAERIAREQAAERAKQRRLDAYRDARVRSRPVLTDRSSDRELLRYLTAIRDQLTPLLAIPPPVAFNPSSAPQRA